jgi:hypothetical protein
MQILCPCPFAFRGDPCHPVDRQRKTGKEAHLTTLGSVIYIYKLKIK